MTFEQSLNQFYEKFGPQSAVVSGVSLAQKLVFIESQFGLYVTWLREKYQD